MYECNKLNNEYSIVYEEDGMYKYKININNIPLFFIVFTRLYCRKLLGERNNIIYSSLNNIVEINGCLIFIHTPPLFIHTKRETLLHCILK